MAKRAKKKRGPKPRYLDIACPNPKCNWKRLLKGTVVGHLGLLPWLQG